MKKSILTFLTALSIIFFLGLDTEKASAKENNNREEQILKSLEVISTEEVKATPTEEPLSEEDKIELKDLIIEQVNTIEKEHAEFKESQSKSLKSNAISTMALNLTSPQVVNLYNYNLQIAYGIKGMYDYLLEEEGLVYANAYRLEIFYELVKTGGAWDIKQDLGKNTKYTFKDVQKTGEYIGNHHYGYMGKAIGFANVVLKSAAGMYQIYSGTSNWSFISSYFDDPADQLAITAGYTDFNNGFRFSNIIA